MHLLLTNEELRILEALEEIGVDPVTIIVHLFTLFGANYDRLPEPTNQEIKQEDPEPIEEFTEALVFSAINMKREVSEVE